MHKYRKSCISLPQTLGGLLFFSSSSGTSGRKMYSIYLSTKAAIVNFALAISDELADDGILVN